MAAAGLHGLFDIQPSSTVASPQPTHQKNDNHERVAPSNIELDNLVFGDRYNGPLSRPSSPSSHAQTPMTPVTPKTPNELETNTPASPVRDDGFGLMQSWNNPPINRWRILCCCLIYFGNGIHDAVVGALIPYMETYYNIGYAVMSMIFVGNAAGFIVAAFFTNTFLGKLGRAKTMVLSELILMAAYIVFVCSPPYPMVIVAFFLLGFGAAINLALNNVFCSNLHPPSAILGATHGSYGIGGTVAPIIGTAMASRGILWSRFYFISLGLRICCIPFAAWSFGNYEQDSPETLLTAVERTTSQQRAAQETQPKLKTLKLALKSRVTIFGALFIFAYQGAEVSVSGWVISFLINYRDGDPARVGYVTAGFWAGITLGRFVLTHLAPRIGEKRFVVCLTLSTMALQLMAWLIPNVIGNAVAVALLGFVLGPVYPCAQTIFTRLMPRYIQTTAIGFIAGAGSSGGAVAPFTTGILAQAVGTWVLHPICLGLYAVMLACWFALPRVGKRTE